VGSEDLKSPGEPKNRRRTKPFILFLLFSVSVVLFIAAPSCAASNFQWSCNYDQDNNRIDVVGSSISPVYVHLFWQDVTTGTPGPRQDVITTDIASTQFYKFFVPLGEQSGEKFLVYLDFISDGVIIDEEHQIITWGDPGSGTGSGDNTPVLPSYNPKGGVFVRLVASIIDGVTDVFNWAVGSLLTTKSGTAITLSALIFNDGLSQTDKLYAPFTATEMNTIWTWYKAMAAGSFVLILIAVVVTAFKFSAAPFNMSMREDAVASLWRWLVAILIIAGAPILFYATVRINNGLVDLFLAIANNVAPGKSLDVMMQPGASPQTGYVLADSVVSLIFSFIRLWLAIIYALRKLVLTVILIFTPLMAWLWSLNKNVNAAQVWLGEILSNIFMQTAHAFVFLILLSFINVGGSGGSPMPPGDYNALYNSLTDLLTSYGVPIGSAILFASVCWVAVQIITSRFNPDRRESAVNNLLYVGAGGIVLGGVMFFASLALGVAQTYFPTIFK
jgi:hypothetical protein